MIVKLFYEIAVAVCKEGLILKLKNMEAILQKRRLGAYIACFLLLVSLLLPGCAVVRPGEVGIKVTLGKIKGKIHQPGSWVSTPLFHRCNVCPPAR